MTKRNAERITGGHITRICVDSKRYVYALFDSEGEGNLLVTADARTASLALAILVNRNWQLVSRQALERDNWRCQKCGKRQNLDVHHVRYRSHGRVDKLENLITLCVACHEKQHTKGRSGVVC